MNDALMVPTPEHSTRKCFMCSSEALVFAFGPVASVPACPDHGRAAKQEAEKRR